MPCAEAYREHIMYTFNSYRNTAIQFTAITHGVTKVLPLGTTGEYFEAPYEEYPITICGQTVILTNRELAAALLSLPERKREIIFLYFFGDYTQQEIGEMYGRCRSTAWHHIHSALQMLHKEMEVLFREES